MKYAVFILTYGRADRVYTYETLKKQGYTGDIYLICSDDDKQLEEYKNRFGKKVIVFNKEDAKKTFDIGDNFSDDRVVVFARNKVWDIAKKLKLDGFIELDDDYTGFYTRKPKGKSLLAQNIQNLDLFFEKTFEFLTKSGATSVALAQGGDYIGGVNSGTYKKGISRKLMNVYFCMTNKAFNFYGRLNEDTTTYTYLGGLGYLFLTVFCAMCVQKETQSNTGGLTEIYRENGTYFKTFYSLMWRPDCVKISTMGEKHLRIHHKVLWNNAVPKIIKEELKKK